METPEKEPPPEMEAPLSGESVAGAETAAGKKSKKKKGDKLGTSRGIETLFRSVYRVHVNLTVLADTKANFLISVNSLIMFLLVLHGISHVEDTILFFPISIVLIACTGSIVFAVLSARPRISREQLLQTADTSKGMNLLFFGDFTRLPKDIFVREFTEVIKDSNKIYPCMMGDIYEIGRVLNKKFRLLQFAYWFLLYGLPSGMIIFLVLEILLMTGRL